jgi:hypothetical protein
MQQIKTLEMQQKAGKRGRPKGTTTKPLQLYQDVWIYVELVRERINMKRSRRPSVSATCNMIERTGGLVWAVGGDIEAVARAMERAERPYSKWQRCRPEPGYFRDDNGRLIVSHRIQNGGSLRTRYSEADWLVRVNPAIRAAWTNMLHDLLGRPRPFLSSRVGVRIGSRVEDDGSSIQPPIQ